MLVREGLSGHMECHPQPLLHHHTQYIVIVRGIQKRPAGGATKPYISQASIVKQFLVQLGQICSSPEWDYQTLATIFVISKLPIVYNESWHMMRLYWYLSQTQAFIVMVVTAFIYVICFVRQAIVMDNAGCHLNTRVSLTLDGSTSNPLTTFLKPSDRSRAKRQRLLFVKITTRQIF